MSTLVSLSVAGFNDRLASDAPAPGGGSAAALAGADGAALLSMVAGLTLGKEKYRDAWDELEAARPRVVEARTRLLELVDEDTAAYDRIVAARKLPKDSPEQKAARQREIDDATLVATTVPMQTAFFAHQALAKAPAILEKGNPNAASDAWVGALLLHACVRGALANVRTNLSGLADAELVRGFKEDAADLEKKAAELMESVRALAGAKGLLG